MKNGLARDGKSAASGMNPEEPGRRKPLSQSESSDRFPATEEIDSELIRCTTSKEGTT